MKISVIVPVYNASKYIRKLIASIEQQTYQDYEIILIDDGSTDDSLKVMTNLSKENEKIKVFTKENTGPGLTRKAGLNEASGDLIFFVDSDDWITSDNVFEKIIYIFSNNNVDVLFFDREDITDNKVNCINGFKKLKQGKHDINDINEKIIPGLGEKIFKRNMLSEDMFINVNIYEDLYTTYLYLDKCKTVYYINENFYTIYHESGIKTLSSLNDSRNIELYLESIDVIISLYNRIISENLKQSLVLRLPPIFLKCYIKYIKNKENTEIKKRLDNIADILIKNNVVPIFDKHQIVKRIIYYLFFEIYKRRKNI